MHLRSQFSPESVSVSSTTTGWNAGKEVSPEKQNKRKKSFPWNSNHNAIVGNN